MRAIALTALLGASWILLGCGKKDSTGSGEKSPEGGTAGAVADKDAVQGRWTLVKIETGEPDAAKLEEALKEAEIIVSGDHLTMVHPKTKKKFHAIITHDATKSPKEVDFIETDETWSLAPTKSKSPTTEREGKPVYSEVPREKTLAIYELNGDNLTVALTTLSGVSRPKEMKPLVPKTRSGAGQSRADFSGVVVLHLTKQK